MHEFTNADRAERASHAVAAYTSFIVTPGHDSPLAFALGGQHAAERFAEVTRHRREEQRLIGAEHAREVIGDLTGDLFHLFDLNAEHATASEVLPAAVLALIQPGHETAAADLTRLTRTAPGTLAIAQTAAAALMAAAVIYELDLHELLDHARTRYAEEVEDERTDHE